MNIRSHSPKRVAQRKMLQTSLQRSKELDQRAKQLNQYHAEIYARERHTMSLIEKGFPNEEPFQIKTSVLPSLHGSLFRCNVTMPEFAVQIRNDCPRDKVDQWIKAQTDVLTYYLTNKLKEVLPQELTKCLGPIPTPTERFNTAYPKVKQFFEAERDFTGDEFKLPEGMCLTDFERKIGGSL